MRFYKITVAGVFEPDSPSTRKLGDSGSEFLEVHSDDFFGDITGDVLAVDTAIVVNSGADRANSWVAVGSVKAADGDDVLVTNATAANSTFAGISERAKYA